MMAATEVLAAGGIDVGGWDWTGDFTTLDLIAAATNALNGALREEPLAAEPKSVYTHDDGRPQLGRKLKGRSQRELKMLGLTVDDEAGS